MTLFSKSGIRPALLGAVFFSFATSTALAGNPAPAHNGHDAEQHVAETINGYTPRRRINAHPRNRNRPFKTYERAGKKVRVIDVTNSGFRVPKTSNQPSQKLAFRKQLSGGVGFESSFERLILRGLRESIDAAKFGNARRRVITDPVNFDEQVGLNGGVVELEQIQQVPIQPGEGQLTEVANDGPLRPRAKIMQVSDYQKLIGEQRAAARARRFNREGDSKHFRFYRDNEAYDVRFPSVVYLNSP